MLNRSKLFVVAVAVGSVMAYSQAAHADTWNFANVSDTIGTPFDSTAGAGAVTGGEGGWSSIVGTGIGLFDTTGIDANGAGLGGGGGGGVLSVEGVGTNSSAAIPNPVDAYFDKGSAGLGVCSAFDGAGTPQCNPTDDDNTGLIGGNGGTPGSTETVTLVFSQAVSLDTIIFAAEGHGAFLGDVLVTGGILVNSLLSAVASGLTALGIDNVWSFTFAGDTDPTSVDNSVLNTFYIESVSASVPNQAPVPLPAAFPLFASGLGVLGLLGWRRRRKAVV